MGIKLKLVDGFNPKNLQIKILMTGYTPSVLCSLPHDLIMEELNLAELNLAVDLSIHQTANYWAVRYTMRSACVFI